jgi:hypothetical protein
MNLKNEYLCKNLTASSFDACLSYNNSTPYSTYSGSHSAALTSLMKTRYTGCLEKLCFIAVDHVTHATLYWIQVQSVPATVCSMVQHTGHSNISCSSGLFFGLALHLAHMMSLSSFGRPAQRMFCFKSAHLSIWTAGLTPWHTTDFSILFMGENNEIPIQWLPKFLENVWIQNGLVQYMEEEFFIHFQVFLLML